MVHLHSLPPLLLLFLTHFVNAVYEKEIVPITFTKTSGNSATGRRSLIDEVCRPAYGRGVGTIPQYCPDGYPDLDGFLCYPLCLSGYDGVGPVCWEECNSNEIDDGGFCRVPLITVAKNTYGRGVGIIPTSCGSKQYDAGLCYNYCASGYYGVGPVCWQYCPWGYADHGATCFKHIFSWFFKSTYGRGFGTIPNQCPSHKPDYDTGLCYPNCAAGYYGVGPVCWQHCNGKDVGALCEIQSLQIRAKHSYGRGVGRIRNKCDPGYVNDAGLCYKACEPDDVWDGVGPVCWNKNFGTALGVVFGSLSIVTGNINLCASTVLPVLLGLNAITAETIKTVDFSAFTDCMWPAMQILSGIDDKWNTNAITPAFEITLGAKSGGSGLKGFAGIAFNFPSANKVDIYGYTGHCNHVTIDVSIAVEVSIVLYRKKEDIPGQVSYFGVGVDIPGTEIGAGISYAFSSECDVVAIAMSAGVGFGVSPFDIEGGVCVSSELELIDTISRRRILADNNNNNNKKKKKKKIGKELIIPGIVRNSKCFRKLHSKYYPRCHSVMTVNKLKMDQIERMCLRIPECIGFVYNSKINRAQILTLLECPINNIEFYDDNDDEEFYINTCDNNRFCDNNGFCELSKPLKSNSIRSGKLINQYYAKCPFDIKIQIDDLSPPSAGNKYGRYGSKWYNIFTFDANGNIPYPGLFINYGTNQYKLQIGEYQCVSKPSKISLITNNNNINNDIFKISIKCKGESSLYLNNKLLCSTEEYNIFDIESSEGQVVTIFGSDSSYKSTNGNILYVKATKAIYPWNGYDDDDDAIFKTVKGRQYLLHENTLTAPFLNFKGNYLIKTDVYLKFDNIINEWTEKKYNIFEIGFDDDLDTETNDIILNYDDDKTYGLMLGISTSDETVRFCYEGNKYFNKNKWNTIKVFIQYRKATLIINNFEGCFIDLSQTPINTHQQTVPLIFASGRFNAVKGSFKNVVIRNNVKSVSRSELNYNNDNNDNDNNDINNYINNDIKEPPQFSEFPKTPKVPNSNIYTINLSSFQWIMVIFVLLSVNITLIYLSCFNKNKSKNNGYGVVKYLSETETESI